MHIIDFSNFNFLIFSYIINYILIIHPYKALFILFLK